MELLNAWLQVVDAQFRARIRDESVPQRLLAWRRWPSRYSWMRRARCDVPRVLAQAARDPIAWQATIAPYIATLLVRGDVEEGVLKGPACRGSGSSGAGDRRAGSGPGSAGLA